MLMSVCLLYMFLVYGVSIVDVFNVCVSVLDVFDVCVSVVRLMSVCPQ